VAQRGAEDIAAWISVWLFDGRMGIVGVDGFRIVQRTGNYITAAGPLAQIDQAAAVAAERELRITGQHELLTGGTSRRFNALFRHTFL